MYGSMLPQPKTDIAFLPLIDRPPAHHATIKTAIDKGLSLMRAAGDDVLIFPADQQLYKIVIDIMFYQPTYIESVIPVLGGMHMPMNFIHATAVIMAGSGMNEILAGTFRRVGKMLSGKKYPQNFRAIRMLVEEMLQCILEGVDLFSHLIIVLDARAGHSRTTKLWSDNLVETVIIMMIFSRAGHEGDWALHLYAVEATLPYSRAAGCHNYARNAAHYVHQGPYSREDHLTLGFSRNFKMRNSVTAEFRKSLFSNYLRKTVVAEFRFLIFMQNTPFFPRI